MFAKKMSNFFLICLTSLIWLCLAICCQPVFGSMIDNADDPSTQAGNAKELLKIAAQEPVRGTPGVATQRAVVNVTDLAGQEALAPLSEKGKAIPPFMPVPRDLKVPTGVETLTEKPPTSESWLPFKTFAPTSPPPSASFLALGDDNTRIPPDVHGAVGPNHLMVTLNSQVRIQNRAGGVISTVSLQTFWASVGPFYTATGAFDPKILYDPYSNRWMFTACAEPETATSSLLIGVSQTSDPTGLWNLYRIDADATNLVWVDYPSMGFNRDWICVQVNVYDMANNFSRSHMYVFNKANLYVGGAGLFTLISSAAIGGTQVPAITYDNTLSTLYLLQTWNGNSGGNGWLRLYTVTGPVGSEVLNLGPFISTPNPWDWAGFTGWNDFAPQLGSAQRIMNNDDRMQNLVYRNGSLWATHTVFLPAGGAATRSAVQWWQLTPAGGIIQRARIYEPTGAFYAFPSITVNQFNDVLIGYSRFSATQYASANYSFRAAADPLNTLQADYVLKAGEAPYYKTFGAGLNRWGDFSNTVVDPVNDINMWTIQEYAATPSGGSDRWGTWWGRIDPISVPTITVTSPNGGDLWLVGGVSFITWSWTGSFTDVKIELSRYDVSFWETLIVSTPNDGTWNWTVTEPISQTCKVRISDAADGDPVDMSDSDFTIWMLAFAPAVNYGAGDAPFSVFCADLDGDNDLDLAVANFGSDNVSILQNNGDGTFASAVDYGAGDYPFSVFCADLDGDNDLDLAVANSGDNNVSILINNGDGTYQTAVNYGAGYSPYSVFCADLDNDTDLDLAVANRYGANVSILMNNGDGTFQSAVNYGAGDAPVSVFCADLDNDNYLDLAVANAYSDNVSILMNNGDGTFQSAVNYGAGDAPVSVFCADLDNDNYLDLAVANANSDNVSILINLVVLPFIRGDANGDGVINAADVVYLINYLYISGPAPNPLQAGDVNSDGVINASDVVYLINYLFISGPPPGC
jgi:hypothetical protein